MECERVWESEAIPPPTKKTKMKTTTPTATDTDTRRLGIDHTGIWTPAQYIIDAGWDQTGVEVTARIGLSDEDADGLTADQQAALLSHCRERQWEDVPKATTTPPSV